MPIRSDDPALRLPHEPYPGLRPFLDHEAPLLQGRARQIEEVCGRLAESQFVAVVGGSGCGKSSLVRAGVVPELRSRGLGKLGIYWIPVVFTPGTATQSSPTDFESQRPSTPLTRLAGKFCKTLELEHDPESGARRELEACELFRRGDGFRRLVETFSSELPQRGPKTDSANFLFVVDQFEELFHHHNRGREDARLIVESIISHFFNPHPRCAVVITMRSENLSDCASYLELPDAINRSMYLVRRLDRAEVHAAIVGPAAFYLRIRDRAGDADLPEEVRFEEALIERLLQDVEALSGDADHLPLLQHVLARTWEAACDRERRPRDGVPHAVTWVDLERACLPEEMREQVSSVPARIGLPGTFNTLRVSLENWASLRFGRSLAGEMRTAGDLQILDALLCRLGYRHPDSGVYLQNRFELQHARDVAAGVAFPLERIKALVDDGFRNEVNYLHWDDDDPDRVTLKVSHEAFIRGWSHFRDLLNSEAERFEEFRLLYRRCRAWDEEGRPAPAAFLSGADLGRIDIRHLDEILSRPQQRKEWLAQLRRTRDGDELVKADPIIEAFLEQARVARQATLDQRRKIQRNQQIGLIVGIALAVLFSGASLVSMSQSAAIESVDRYAAGRIEAERAPGGESLQLERDHANIEILDMLLRAANNVAAAKQKQADVPAIARWWPTLPLIGRAGQLPYLAGSEAQVNGTLRNHLVTGLWLGDPASKVEAQFYPKVHAGLTCKVPAATGEVLNPVKGALLIEATSLDSPGSRSNAHRMLFVPDPRQTAIAPELRDKLSLHVVTTFDGKDDCVATPSYWSLDLDVKPQLIIDARLRYVGLRVNNPRGTRDPKQTSPYRPDHIIETYEFDWKRARMSGKDTFLAAPLKKRKETNSALVAVTLNTEFSKKAVPTLGPNLDPLVRILPSWRESGGYGLMAGGYRWRLLDDNAQRLEKPNKLSTEWSPLKEAPESNRTCKSLRDGLTKVYDSNSSVQGDSQSSNRIKFKVMEWDSHCIEIRTLPAQLLTDDTLDQNNKPAVPRMTVSVSLYENPNFDALERVGLPVPTAVATVIYFEERRQREGPPIWKVATKGHFKGWIGIWDSTSDGKSEVWAAPLTTEALTNLGRELCRDWKLTLSAPGVSVASGASSVQPVPNLACAP